MIYDRRDHAADAAQERAKLVAELQAENAALKARIAELEEEKKGFTLGDLHVRRLWSQE